MHKSTTPNYSNIQKTDEPTTGEGVVQLPPKVPVVAVANTEGAAKPHQSAGAPAPTTKLSLAEILNLFKHAAERHLDFIRNPLLVNETLIRNDFVTIMAPIIRDFLSGNPRPGRTLLQGIGGCGKSTFLAQAVALLRRAGAVVFSIPKLSAFVTPDDQTTKKVAIDCISRNIEFGEAALKAWNLQESTKHKYRTIEAIKSLWDLMQLREHPDTNSLQILVDCLDEIFYSNSNSRGIIVVDQWNAVDSGNSEEVRNFFKKILYITKHDGRKSFFLGATSSSFILSSETLADGDLMQVPCRILHYSQVDFERVWTVYQQSHKELEGINKEYLMECTGSIPRLVATYASLYLQNAATADAQFMEKSVLYYQIRLEKLVQKDRGKSFADFATSLFARGCADANIADTQLLQTGLVRREGNVLIPVCPPARKALAISCIKYIDIIMSTLAADPSLFWRAFELYFCSAWELEGSERMLQLYGKNMIGTKKLSVEISCSKKIYRKSSGGTFSDFTMEKGGFCVLAPNFPVVDFAARSAHNDKLIVVQISKSVYSRHPTKAEDLYAITVRTNIGDEVVADFLFRCAFGRKRTPKDVIQYVYISPVKGYCTKDMSDAMIVCELAELAKINEKYWHAVQLPMQKLAGIASDEHEAPTPKGRGTKRSRGQVENITIGTNDQDQADEEQPKQPSAKRDRKASRDTASASGAAAADPDPTEEQVAKTIISLVDRKKVKKPQQLIGQKFCLKISNAELKKKVYAGLEAMGVPVVPKVSDGVHVIMDIATASSGKKTEPCYVKNLRLLPIGFIEYMFKNGSLPIDIDEYEDMRSHFK